MSAKTLLKSLVKRSSRKAVVFSLFGLSSFAVASPSFAASVNLSNFTSSGDVGNVTPSQATLTNAIRGGGDDVINPNNIVNVSGVEPTEIGALETFLGVSQGFLGNDPGSNATQGSAIRTSTPLSFLAGDAFSFDYNFVTNDTPGFDRAFVTIGSLPRFDLLQGSNSFNYTFTTASNSNIGIGVVDVNDTVVSSRLSVANANIQPVPEPLTILGSGIAAGFGVMLKRKQAKKA
ncbi:MAG: PEP-CTERM sorting domain-containing protein [Hassallia sp.]